MLSCLLTSSPLQAKHSPSHLTDLVINQHVFLCAMHNTKQQACINTVPILKEHTLQCRPQYSKIQTYKTDTEQKEVNFRGKALSSQGDWQRPSTEVGFELSRVGSQDHLLVSLRPINTFQYINSVIQCIILIDKNVEQNRISH